MSITDDDINELRTSSQQVQNWPMAALCRKALQGDGAARERVEKIITGARDARLMAEFLALKDAYDRVVAGYQDSISMVAAMRRARDRAFAALTDLKAGQGEPTRDDPLCCQRYTRLHDRALAVPGCRWFEPEASRT